MEGRYRLRSDAGSSFSRGYHLRLFVDAHDAVDVRSRV